MGNAPRWTREFSTESSFADDLGGLGAWVGPRTGLGKRTQGQKEDYVLRRVLVALHRQGELRFPFTVHASSQAPGEPDFIFTDSSGCWGVEVTEAGSERHQRAMTDVSKSSVIVGAEPALRRLAPFDDGIEEIRRAIEKKNKKYDEGAYRRVSNCDLAIYDNINSYSCSDDEVADVSQPCLEGRFRRVVFVQDEQVYIDVLANRPNRVDIVGDYNIDFAEWVSAQINLLREGDFSRLDVEQLIEELSELARSQRRALRSHLRNLLLHLLKWQYQPERRTTSWQRSIDNARDEIDDLLMQSPSIKDEFGDIASLYQQARRNAAGEMQRPVDDLPEACPFALESEILLVGWLPASQAPNGG